MYLRWSNWIWKNPIGYRMVITRSNIMGYEYYSVSWALQTLPWTLCLAIWCEIIRVISQSSHLAALALLNHKYDFKPRLHDTKCNHHCQNKGIFNSVQSYWSSTEIVCNVLHDFPNALSVFYFTSIWLVTLNESWNLISCFVLGWIFLNITFVPAEFWYSFNAQVMARCHVISQNI